MRTIEQGMNKLNRCRSPRITYFTQLLKTNSVPTGTDLQSMDQRRYIDPGNYLDLMELLSTFTTEIERSKTKLDRLIGQG